jgi:hypothetical protein
MIGSSLRRAAVLLPGLCATPLARAQEAAAHEMPVVLIATLAGLGMLFVVGIVAVTLFHDRTKRRERLALVEKLITAGHPVPRELLVDGPVPPTLPEERRRDMRRGVTGLCWAAAIAVAFYFVSGGQLRAAAWGLFPLILGLGSFLRAWLTAREIARGSADGPR